MFFFTKIWWFFPYKGDTRWFWWYWLDIDQAMVVVGAVVVVITLLLLLSQIKLNFWKHWTMSRRRGEEGGWCVVSGGGRGGCAPNMNVIKLFKWHKIGLEKWDNENLCFITFVVNINFFQLHIFDWLKCMNKDVKTKQYLLSIKVWWH